MKKVLLLFLSLFFLNCFAQVQSEIEKEAHPDESFIVDDSEFAQLLRGLINARERDAIEEYEQIKTQLQNKYSHRFVGKPIEASDQVLIPVEKEFSSSDILPDGVNWGNELEIFNGNIGISTGGNPAVNKRMIKMISDTLGNLYAACITNWYSADTLAFFKSTDKGLTWNNFRNIWSGPGVRYQAFDIAIADTAGGKWKIGIVVSLTPVGGNGYRGKLYYGDMEDNGSNFSSVLVEPDSGLTGCVSPVIISDAYDYSPGLSFWYIAYQRVDTLNGETKQVIAAYSTNGGLSWLQDTARANTNDYQLDIDYSKTDTFFVYVLWTNNVNPSNENLRLRYIPLTEFGTASYWYQYNITESSKPEYDGNLAVNRQSEKIAVVYTSFNGSDTDIEYAYSLNGKVPFTRYVPLTSTGSNEERASIHSPENQLDVFRVSYAVNNTQDSVLYRNTTNISSGFGAPVLVSRVNQPSGSVTPSVCGFRIGSAFAGGVIFAGFGPTGLYFNSSYLLTDVEENNFSPDDYALYQNYPNPFNPSTKIMWQSPVSGWQTLKVYDVLGNQVATLVNEYREAGRNEVEFDASRLSSGIYIYTLSAGGFISSKKMILIK